MRAALGVLLSTFLTSCGGSPGAAPAAPTLGAPAAECSHRHAPRASASLAAQPSSAASRAAKRPAPAKLAPPSRLVVHAQLSLATLGAELERHIAPRLAEDSGVRLGPAGALDYSVDRGAFSLSLASDHLVVETPVNGRAQACRGRRCYASCEPRALVRAEVPLWLTPDYRFGRSRVSLRFTRGCRIRAFGGLLDVNVTPLLESALAPRLERVGREIDRRLPDVRAEVERGWRELATPRPLPIGGCLVVAPLGLVQGPMQQAGALAHARFALLARPELRTDCGEPALAPPLPPLPPLAADRALPDEDVVTLGMELPLSSLARAFEASPPDADADATPRHRVAEARLEAAGPSVAAELELRGELCGAVALHAQPTLVGEDGVVELSAGTLDAGESERIRSAGLDPDALLEQLTRRPRVTAPLSLSMLRAAPPALSWLFSNPTFSLDARGSSLGAAGATARGEQLVAWVEARGSLWLEQK